jgi:hypothetical protein
MGNLTDSVIEKAALCDTLLPKLLSGESRMKDTEWPVEEAT